MLLSERRRAVSSTAPHRPNCRAIRRGRSVAPPTLRWPPALAGGTETERQSQSAARTALVDSVEWGRVRRTPLSG